MNRDVWLDEAAFYRPLVEVIPSGTTLMKQLLIRVGGTATSSGTFTVT